jgi:hypothetical protein
MTHSFFLGVAGGLLCTKVRHGVATRDGDGAIYTSLLIKVVAAFPVRGVSLMDT